MYIGAISTKNSQNHIFRVPSLDQNPTYETLGKINSLNPTSMKNILEGTYPLPQETLDKEKHVDRIEENREGIDFVSQHNKISNPVVLQRNKNVFPKKLNVKKFPMIEKFPYQPCIITENSRDENAEKNSNSANKTNPMINHKKDEVKHSNRRIVFYKASNISSNTKKYEKNDGSMKQLCDPNKSTSTILCSRERNECTSISEIECETISENTGSGSLQIQKSKDLENCSQNNEQVYD